MESGCPAANSFKRYGRQLLYFLADFSPKVFSGNSELNQTDQPTARLNIT